MTKIWITGGSGMVGRNLRAHPIAKSHQVLAPERSELDLMYGEAVSAWLADAMPDIIIHNAGKVGGISANMSGLIEFLDANTMIGRNVLMAARSIGIPRVINLASSCFYPVNGRNPLSEDQILTGALEQTNEGYALAKVFCQRLCAYISRDGSGLAYKTLIPCNLFGPWDDFSPHGAHMLPAVIAKIHAARQQGSPEVEIWGDGTARREFMYAQDAADGIWAAVERFDDLPDVMNLGMGHDLSVREYYHAVANVIGWNGKFVLNLDRPVGVKRKLMDTSRQAAFGWQPKCTLEEGIAKTYAYFLNRKRSAAR
ncbi:MAG: NAD-dependent epimerase/dehydratase family protein [Thiotrichales bacterium]|nr:NAD-dependent epimerase/dehydratase family protein [Thiotrichales bacterium]